ncbi:hypothetical protein [Trichormus sp. NMC-1]|uniref:hypothetical protein n=1 Tax=Trichormus sp. NMC-1 TaxID=1853259 RepID=UPI0015A71A5F|nr:hypothetical protein [Trichormus sp. NMC-1]
MPKTNKPKLVDDSGVDFIFIAVISLPHSGENKAVNGLLGSKEESRLIPIVF